MEADVSFCVRILVTKISLDGDTLCRWDEYVPESRLLKLNDANLAKQKQLQESAKSKAFDMPPNSATGGGFYPNKKRMDTSGLNSSTSRGTKRARESANTPALDGEEEWQKKPEIKLSIPDVLKVQLVDDWEAVTKNNQLVPLPRSPNVQDVLKAYEDELREATKPA